MTFLYDDIVLAKLLADSGVVADLYKKAQDAQSQAKELALQLANNLLRNNTNVGEKSADIYVKDVVDLDAFLNYLYKNHKLSNDGQSIVLQSKGINGQQPEAKLKDLYKNYNDWWVHSEGLTSRLNTLNIEANKVGNEVLKPFVKQLISEAKQVFNIDITDTMQTTDSANPYDKEQSNSKYHVGFSADEKTLQDANYKNVSDKSKSTKPTTLQEDITSIQNVLPFPSTNMISPHFIYLFIDGMFRVISKMAAQQPQSMIGPFLGQFEQYHKNIYKNYTSWSMFIVNKANNKPALNLSSIKDMVPYDLSDRPNTKLEMMFANTADEDEKTQGRRDAEGEKAQGRRDAKDASRFLLQMVYLAEQALMTLQQSPQLSTILNQDNIKHQLQIAKSFTISLTPFAR